MEDFGVSICISTNAAKTNKTKMELKSLRNAIAFANLPAEIIICGDVEPFIDQGAICIDEKEAAHSGMLSLLRNQAAKHAQYNILLFVDDDFLFPQDWVLNLYNYTLKNDWDVLTNKIFLPTGGRFWDRAQVKPHKLLPYDHDPKDPNLYITGGFWLITRKLFDVEPWDSSLTIYATENGAAYNEDVELSIRMHNRGVPLLMDPNNYVWHWDEKYTQRNHVVVLRKDYKDTIEYKPSQQFQAELLVLMKQEENK